jgi:hypothetical protein
MELLPVHGALVSNICGNWTTLSHSKVYRNTLTWVSLKFGLQWCCDCYFNVCATARTNRQRRRINAPSRIGLSFLTQSIFQSGIQRKNPRDNVGWEATICLVFCISRVGSEDLTERITNNDFGCFSRGKASLLERIIIVLLCSGLDSLLGFGCRLATQTDISYEWD